MTALDFKEVLEFIEEMNVNNSSLDKTQVLIKYKNSELVPKTLFYTYTPYKQYNVKSDSLKKRSDLVATINNYDSFMFNLLDDLNDRVITGHAAIEAVNAFTKENPELKDLLYKIIDRNLEIRVTATTINKTWENLIPVFSVALCADYDKNKKGVNFSKDIWFSSRKLDGVRCLAVIRNKVVKFFSRNGKEFYTLSKLAEKLISLGYDNIVLDGEICVMNEDGTDDFQGIMKQMQRKDYSIEKPKFWVFDVLTLPEFDSGEGLVIFEDRLKRFGDSSNTQELDDIFKANSEYLSNNFASVSLLPQTKVESSESLEKLREEASANNWEGLIIRKNVGYLGDRSRNMLKVKQFHDAEYVVVNTEMASMRIIIDKKEVTEEMLGAVMVEHKGNIVRVGSGFTLDERREYYADPSKILGKTITVKYFEETTDQHGQHSLRFPVFKTNHGDKRTT